MCCEHRLKITEEVLALRLGQAARERVLPMAMKVGMTAVLAFAEVRLHAEVPPVAFLRQPRMKSG